MLLDKDDLMNRIIENPDDDSVRLYYASAIQKVDSDLSEFIRYSISLSRIGCEHPDYFRIAHRVSKLVPEQRVRVLVGWPEEVANSLKFIDFNRGFVELLTISASNLLNHAQKLFSLAPIRHLNILEAKKYLPEIASQPWLRRIRSLSISQCGLDDQDIATFLNSSDLHELCWLNLSYNQIGVDGIRNMIDSKSVPKLRHVNLSGNLVDPCEHLCYDQAVLADWGLPPEGEQLEQQYGHISWLHKLDPSGNPREDDRFSV